MSKPPLELLEPSRFKLTDYGNAERLAKKWGSELRYVRNWKAWLFWDQSRWCRDTVGVATVVAKHVIRELYDEAAALAKEAAAGNEIAAEHAAALTAWARRCETAHRLRDMVSLAETEAPIAATADAFDRDGFALNVLNGTIDLRTGKQHAHRQEDMITMLAPVIYDPAANAPNWERFLERILPDADVRAWLQRFVGYSLTSNVDEQILTFLWGQGSNGKSTFLNAIQAVLGDYAFQGPPGLLIAQERGGDDLGRRQRAVLLGKRLVVVQEVEVGRYLNETQVKQLTGGDKVTAARLYEQEMEFLPTHKLVVAANHRPAVKSQDYGTWRRVRLVPFTETILPEERDPGLGATLRAEASGILVWAVRGCLEWQRDGLKPPAAVADATDSYREDEDRLGDFLRAETVTEAGATVLLADLHKRYRGWCMARGEMPWSNKALAAALEERGWKSDKPKAGKRFVGMRLTSGGG